ncbi:integrase/recombinase XerD [Deinococcus metalli]|uniref:Integrase/recombinase XerD n=1 Tax=Deinococcus metalli TaxID=1141878 RepID=A0A7W8KJI0_9DEIO|nr:tyrosine-type recombinase/integrase [Deinococcus metalli]MBB5379065.1 integrase/recombinase XerD [Deinococcus metalli]GHF63984.1 tyrosine recombinase XerD [Deinococcus metalli]
MTWDQLWEQFYYHLRIKRRAKTTLHFYGTTQRALQRFAAATGSLPTSPDLIRVSHLRDFIVWLEGQGLAPGGIHAHVRSLKSLFGWAHREELLTVNPSARLERPSLPRRRMATMTADAVSRLLKASKRSDQPLRDAAVVLTFFDTGVRLEELISLRKDDVKPEKGVLRVIGKGDRERSAPIGTRALSAINTYMLRERHPRHAGIHELFLNRRGQPMTRSCISILLKRLSAQEGFERAETTPHTFRRGFAVEFLRNGGDVFTLQQILGHSSLEMTRRYVNFLDEDLKAAHLRFSPGDRL